MSVYTICIIFGFIAFAFDAYCRAVRSGSRRAWIFPLTIMPALLVVTALSLRNKALFQPIWFEDFVLLDFAACTGFVLIWAMRRVRSRELLFGVIVAAGVTVITLAGAEWRLRAYKGETYEYGMIGQNRPRKLDTGSLNLLHRDIPGQKEQRELHDRGVRLFDYFGISDEKLIPLPRKEPGERRVMWIGDSMTLGVQVPWDKRFASLLEKRMNRPHYVFAVDGTATDLHAVVLERFHGMIQPELVVLGFYAGNDCFGIGMAHERADYYPTPLFDIDRGEFTDLNLSPAERFYLDVKSTPPNAVIWFAANYTMIGNLALKARERMLSGIAHKFFFDTISEIERDDYSARYAKRKAAACRLVRRMADFSHSRGSEFAVVFLPFKPVPGTREEGKRYRFWRPAECHQCLMDCLENSGIPLLDASGLAGDMPGADENSVLLADMVHLNLRGHERMSELIYPFLQDLSDASE